MPMKLTSGCSVAEAIRKRPLPEPISTTTRFWLPKSSPKPKWMKPLSRGLITTSIFRYTQCPASQSKVREEKTLDEEISLSCGSFARCCSCLCQPLLGWLPLGSHREPAQPQNRRQHDHRRMEE